MNTFTIPLVNKKLFIYVGKAEWSILDIEAQKDGALPLRSYDDEAHEGAGRHFGSHVWVDNLDRADVLIHELSHYIDEVMGELRTNDTEFRAWITEWVITNVLEWTGKLNVDT